VCVLVCVSVSVCMCVYVRVIVWEEGWDGGRRCRHARKWEPTYKCMQILFPSVQPLFFFLQQCLSCSVCVRPAVHKSVCIRPAATSPPLSRSAPHTCWASRARKIERLIGGDRPSKQMVSRYVCFLSVMGGHTKQASLASRHTQCTQAYKLTHTHTPTHPHTHHTHNRVYQQSEGLTVEEKCINGVLGLHERMQIHSQRCRCLAVPPHTHTLPSPPPPHGGRNFRFLASGAC